MLELDLQQHEELSGFVGSTQGHSWIMQLKDICEEELPGCTFHFNWKQVMRMKGSVLSYLHDLGFTVICDGSLVLNMPEREAKSINTHLQFVVPFHLGVERMKTQCLEGLRGQIQGYKEDKLPVDEDRVFTPI